MTIPSSHWRRWLPWPWAVALAVGLVLAGMRVLGVLGPVQWRWLLPLGFVVMAVLPWLLMTAPGRRSIGLCRATDRRFYALALGAGCATALVCGLLGLAVFGMGADNWFVSIATNYRNTLDTRGLALWQLHLFFTLPACLFSPVGEEIFFRGLLHGALQERFGATGGGSLRSWLVWPGACLPPRVVAGGYRMGVSAGVGGVVDAADVWHGAGVFCVAPAQRIAGPGHRGTCHV